MTIINTFIYYIQYLGIYEWHDAFEIAFLSWVFFRIIVWLKRDQLSLLEYFYLYCVGFFLSYFNNFEILSRILFISAPCTASLFILMHQKSLQQNYITIKKKYKQTQVDWISSFISALLVAMNKNKNIICVIERSQSLEDLIQTSAFIEANFNTYLLSALIESPLFEEDKLVWCNQKGKLLSFNARWKEEKQSIFFSEEIQAEHRWKQEALFYTHHTDCIVIKLHAASRKYEIIAQASIAEKVDTLHLANFLYKTFNIASKINSNKDIIKEKDDNGIPFKKHYQKQLYQ